MKSVLVGVFAFVLPAFISVASFASVGPTYPDLPNNLQCLDNNRQVLPVNNDQVAYWEGSTQDQYHNRGLIQGQILKVYPNQNGHTHFAVSMGNGNAIEVIFNDEFGGIRNVSVGAQVTACGDYITVGRGARLPSPQPAILHWVHYNPGNRDGGRHPGGFVIINGVPYGLTGG